MTARKVKILIALLFLLLAGCSSLLTPTPQYGTVTVIFDLAGGGSGFSLTIYAQEVHHRQELLAAVFLQLARPGCAANLRTAGLHLRGTWHIHLLCQHDQRPGGLSLRCHRLRYRDGL